VRDENLEEELPQPHDSALQRRLAQLDRLEPPAELDQLVLARAREAIQAPPPALFYRAPRWALPFGLAATVAIGCGLWLAFHGAHPLDAPRLAPATAALARAADSNVAATASISAAPVSPAQPLLAGAAGAAAPLPAPPVTQGLQRSLRHIEKLRSQGKSAEAEREWTALLERYPGLRQRSAASSAGEAAAARARP